MIYVEAENTFVSEGWVYNPIMAKLDKNSKQVDNPDGNHEVNAWAVDEVYGDRIAISFIYYAKVTDDHVDEYAVVNQTTSTKEDARRYANLVIDVLDGKYKKANKDK